MPVHDGVRSGVYCRSMMFTPYKTGNRYFSTDPFSLQVPWESMKCGVLLMDDFWIAASTAGVPDNTNSLLNPYACTPLPFHLTTLQMQER